ncbi:hypothetical protein G3M54_04630 [Bacillus megaterium NBRC 15308 = ATCC 14581]|nr:hypothetical protein [Priestia megaterium NBRC 15308 = ATCC 14581]
MVFNRKGDRDNEKITGLGFACVLLVSPFLATGNVSAAETGKQLTEQYQINWDNAWENSDASNQSVDFGTSSNSQQISASGWGDLASGKTVLSATTKQFQVRERQKVKSLLQ